MSSGFAPWSTPMPRSRRRGRRPVTRRCCSAWCSMPGTRLIRLRWPRILVDAGAEVNEPLVAAAGCQQCRGGRAAARSRRGHRWHGRLVSVGGGVVLGRSGHDRVARAARRRDSEPADRRRAGPHRCDRELSSTRTAAFGRRLARSSGRGAIRAPSSARAANRTQADAAVGVALVQERSPGHHRQRLRLRVPCTATWRPRRCSWRKGAQHERHPRRLRLFRHALHYAAFNGHRAMVDFLIARGADVNMKDTKIGQTAASWADHARQH